MPSVVLRRVRRALLALASCLATVPAAAQGGADSASRAAAGPGTSRMCTYDACAVRLEGGFLGQRLVVGADGRTRLRGRPFGLLPIDSVVRGVPRAAYEASRYRREASTGSLLVAAGTVLVVAASVSASEGTRADCRGSFSPFCGTRGLTATNTALLLGGVALEGVGAWRLGLSTRALSRAIWWYNREFAR